MGTFHSAVNRIPVPREDVRSRIRKGELPKDIFGDGKAPGHDHLEREGWSGTIDLEMTVRTPLVFGDQYREDAEGNRLKESDGLKKIPGSRNVVKVPMDGSGRPFISPTMVKGMVSRAYETLTVSRFRVFGEHRDPLTYRVDPSQANQLFPARVCRDEAGDLAVEILDTKESVPLLDTWKDETKGIVATTAKQTPPSFPPKPGPSAKEINLLRFQKLTPHGIEVDVGITCWRRDTDKYDRLLVTHAFDHDKKQYIEFIKIPEDAEKLDYFKATGFAFRTIPDNRFSHDFCDQKWYEKFFFKFDENGNEIRCPVLKLSNEKIRDYYKIVIESYRKESIKRKGRLLLNRASQGPAGQKIEDWPAPDLSEGDLVFVRLETTGKGSSTSCRVPEDAEVCEILPTMVGRRAYQKSPRELAENQLVAPLKNRDEASPADRLFGYVVPETTGDAKGGDVAYRGRVSFGPVDTSKAKLSHEEKKLAPLLEPKVSSARRFLTDDTGATPKRNGHYLPRQDYFTSDQLLGTAIYPAHYAPSFDADGFPTCATKLPKSNLNQDNDDVRITAKTWIEKGSTLKCTLRFENLGTLELAALVWVLTPENLVPAEARNRSKNAGDQANKVNGQESAKPVGFLRMGLGKPFGLGAIEVRATSVMAYSNQEIAEGYEALTGCLGYAIESQKRAYGIADFSALLDKYQLDEEIWIQAMQRAAYGYDDGVEVRYMSLDENKTNNQTDSKTGQPQKGLGLSPTDLSAPKSSFKSYRPAPMTISKSKNTKDSNE